jgi:GTPase SAR1 family protein
VTAFTSEQRPELGPEPEPTPATPRTATAVAVVDLGIEACAAYEREDLVPRLVAAKQRLLDPDARILVVGEFKKGKSSLINALLDTSVCPVDDDIATSVPTLLGYSPHETAVAWHEPETPGGEPIRRPVPVDQLGEHVSEAGNPDNERRLRLVEVGLPRRLLQRGVSIVDTPGVGGFGSSHGAMTTAALPTAEAVLVVTDASQELTDSEISFLRRARELCPNLSLVLTKVDLYPEWRKVCRLDRQHLDREGFADVPILALSSALRLLALRTGDVGLNDESGFVELIAHLRTDVVGVAEMLGIRSAANAVGQAALVLRSRFETERDALADPLEAGRLQRDLEDARSRADRLRSDAARWQTTLTDGIADLNADVDHDLRRRTRAVIATAETRIDDGDPADWWPELETWLRQQIAQEVADNYTLLARRTEALARLVAEHFAAGEGDDGVEVAVEPPLDMLADLHVPEVALPGVVEGVRARAVGVASQGFTALRGSYGGYLMFNMIGGMVGLAAMNPAILGVTVLMGRKSIRDEKQRLLAQRRQQAKVAVRRYVEEVSFQVGKDSRDALRRVQRQLRDGFTERAEQVQRSVTEKLAATQHAVEAEQGQRQARLLDVDAELGRLRHLIDRVRPLAPDLIPDEAPGPTADPATGVR